MQEPNIISICDGAWRFEDGSVRCFLFEGDEKALLVDSGKTVLNVRDVVQSLASKPVMLVNTHADFDHIASNPQFEVAYMHPAEYPYYTTGSISLLDKQNRILIGGDGIQDGDIYMYGSQRSLTAYLHSLKRLAARMEEFDTVYPSHGSFPVPSAQIIQLIKGVEKMMSGEILGSPANSFGTPIRIYDLGAARILYDEHITF